MCLFLTRILTNLHELLLSKAGQLLTHTEKFMLIRDNSCLNKYV